MAIDAHSTPAPVDHRASLGTHGAPCRVLGEKGILSQVAKEIPDLPPSFIGAVPTPALTAETATNTTRRKELYEILHPGTVHGGDRKSSRQIGDLNDRFTADTAERTGRSERAVQRAAARGEALGADLNRIVGTSLDKGVEMDAVPADVRHHGAPICSAADLPCGDIPTTDLASALHMRRALEGAIEHGMALMDALGLPKIPQTIPLDAPAIGDALDTAIATLDVLDAPGVDLEDDGTAEPSLGWIDGKPTLSDSHDDREAEDDDEPILGAPERHPSCYQFALCDATSSQEHWADGSARHDEAEVVNEDGGDILDEGEETLGWAANVSQLALGQTTADGDETALERHGRGFVRSGPDDAEDDDPGGCTAARRGRPVLVHRCRLRDQRDGGPGWCPCLTGAHSFAALPPCRSSAVE